jgi:DNA invertase Pin-like site-specific DNA recombinase
MMSPAASPADNTRFVAYYRVSTEKQGRSGLGLEAQQAAVRAYLSTQRGHVILAEMTEVESGKRSDRPKLQEALALCRVTGARLVVAKLDRLARNAAFLLSLRNAGVPFIAADMPDANEMTVGIMAVVAEGEAKAISRRTREALAAAKKRGMALGGWRGGPVPNDKARQNAVAARRSKAATHAADVRPIIDSIIAATPDVSMGCIAAELKARGVRTALGSLNWQAVQVRRLLRR